MRKRFPINIRHVIAVKDTVFTLTQHLKYVFVSVSYINLLEINFLSCFIVFSPHLSHASFCAHGDGLNRLRRTSRTAYETPAKFRSDLKE